MPLTHLPRLTHLLDVAQLSVPAATSVPVAAPTAPSVEAVGLFVLIAVMLSRWLWDYSRHQRETAAQYEPRAHPPLHQTYVARDDFEKILHVERTALDLLRTETNTELKRSAARRAEIYDEQKGQGERLARVETETRQQSADLTAIKHDIAELHDRIDALPQRLLTLLLDAQKVAAKN